MQKHCDVHFGGLEIKLGTAVDDPRGIQKIIDQMGDAQHRRADLTRSFVDLSGAYRIFHFAQPPSVSVDNSQRRAKLMRSHGDEISLQQGKTLLLRQLPFQHRCLARQNALAANEFDGVVAKDDRRLSHFADLVAPISLGNFGIGVVGRELPHAVRQIQEWRRDRARDVDEAADDHDTGYHDAEQDKPKGLPIRRA